MEIKIRDNELVLKPQDVAEIAKAVLSKEEKIDQDKEHFWVFGMNSRNIIKYMELVSLGSLNASLVHPREVYRLAVFKGVAHIIVCHNHPSGDSGPSSEDIRMTTRLTEAGKIMGIELLDHIIISTGDTFSFKEKGLM